MPSGRIMVVLDFCLPDMDGSDVNREISAMHPSLPVILLSGMLDLSKALALSVPAVVVKGDGAHRLLSTIQAVLNPTWNLPEVLPRTMSVYASTDFHAIPSSQPSMP